MGYNLDEDPPRRSVLLVESDHAAGLAMAEWLKSNRVRVVWAQSAAEALSMLQDLHYIESPPDGVLAGYGLSDGTGLRVIQEFLGEHPGKPVALMSTHTDLFMELWAHARRVPVFRKPVARHELISWLDQMEAGTGRNSSSRRKVAQSMERS